MVTIKTYRDLYYDALRGNIYKASSLSKKLSLSTSDGLWLYKEIAFIRKMNRKLRSISWIKANKREDDLILKYQYAYGLLKNKLQKQKEMCKRLIEEGEGYLPSTLGGCNSSYFFYKEGERYAIYITVDDLGIWTKYGSKSFYKPSYSNRRIEIYDLEIKRLVRTIPLKKVERRLVIKSLEEDKQVSWLYCFDEKESDRILCKAW